MNIWRLLKNDIRYQFKYGFYYVYTFISFLYIFILRYIPQQWKEKFFSFIIFSDICVIGFFFIGGIVLLEKIERTLEYLIITPVKISEYIISKILSFIFIGIIVTTAISVFGGVINYGRKKRLL